MNWNIAKNMYIPEGVNVLNKIFAIEPKKSTAIMLNSDTNDIPFDTRISGAYIHRTDPNVELNTNMNKMIKYLIKNAYDVLRDRTKIIPCMFPMDARPTSVRILLPYLLSKTIAVKAPKIPKMPSIKVPLLAAVSAADPDVP